MEIDSGVNAAPPFVDGHQHDCRLCCLAPVQTAMACTSTDDMTKTDT